MPFKSGFIAIIGRPNAGKSTFLNRVIGEKVSIVSPRPQTTRNRVRGVWNTTDAQIVFIDTPGIHNVDESKGSLNEFMVREAKRALADVDGVLYMVDAEKGVTEDDEVIMEVLKKTKAPVILAVNKVDAVKKEVVLPIIDTCSKGGDFAYVIPVSSLTGDGVNLLLDKLAGLLKEGPKYFPDDMITDQPERFIVAEMVREKIFLFLRQEIPYSVAVITEEFKEDAKKNLISIRAAINVERDSQKGILIGKKGAMLKKIGTSARKEIEKLLGTKVFLELFVKVQKGWTRSEKDLKEFGYD